MSVCKEIELVGVSSKSWERAAQAAVEHATESFSDLCLVRRSEPGHLPKPIFTTEVSKLDMTIQNGKVHQYRAFVKVCFTYSVSSSAPED
jgi:flavin-binding protein dodecin